MKVHAQKLALAAAAVGAILYVACRALVAAMPEAAMAVTESMLHMSVDGATWQLSASSLLGGAIAWAMLCGGGVWATAALYNRLLGDAD